ncbi:discoidin domain-containing protein [Actinoplanes sp. KI2]|uniref:discoidin domain-containing protein n=1 Tax=Actinoplanes sp. KI2 TaxID=2983315 RepID=UPI0021D5AC94|nr:discoidin domain-containing protein [Actinoplanes sp. KI2]MCU7726174.1 discoidin domain-containing protein [Actinoplanes sp. KI2]
MEGAPTDSADVPNQRTAAERAAVERAASLRAVFASSPRPGQGPDTPRVPGETTGSRPFAGVGRPGAGAPGGPWPSAGTGGGSHQDAATRTPKRRKRRLWLIPVVILLLAIGGGAAYVAMRGNPFRTQDRVATVDPSAGSQSTLQPIATGPAASFGPSIDTSALGESAPSASASASASPPPSPVGRPNPAKTDLALHKKAKSLSDEQPQYPAAAAVDGDPTTRWSSGFSDPQWIRVDLGAVWSVTDIKLYWENASAKSYHVDVSLDAKHWTTVYRTTSGTAGVRDIPVPPTPARYVRMYGTERNSQFGYSLLEFEVR